MVQWPSTRVASKTRTPSPGAHPNILCIGHMWMAPACEGVKFCSGDLVGCGHMSGPFTRRIWPLALMKFAERVPIKTTR